MDAPKRRPNLFVIGAMKSGTTTLHEMLARSPDIYMSELKEPMFFMKHTPTEQDRAQYEALFAASGAARFVGESSTAYAKRPTISDVEKRIHAHAPDARIIYIMRDPVDRAVSHYWFNWRKRDEREPFETAVDKDVEYVAFGNYAMQIGPYIDIFGRDHVHTLTTEELQADPVAAMASITDWLGVRRAEPAPAARVSNKRPGEMYRTQRYGAVSRVARSRIWKAARNAAPASIHRGLRRAAMRPFDPNSVDTNEGIAKIRPVLRHHTEDLRGLLDRDFPEWSTLYAEGE